MQKHHYRNMNRDPTMLAPQILSTICNTKIYYKREEETTMEGEGSKREKSMELIIRKIKSILVKVTQRLNGTLIPY